MSPYRAPRPSHTAFSKARISHGAPHNPIDRRTTIAEIPLTMRSTSYTSVPRVSKVQSPKYKKDRFEGVIANELETQLDEYALILVNSFNQKLAEAESKINEDLGGLLHNFGSACSILEHAEQPLLKSFADESINLTHSEDGTNIEDVPIKERIEKYRQEITTKEHNLARLWEDWSVVQRDVVCLAVEVLGKDIVKSDNKVPDDFREAVKKAQELNQQASEQENPVIGKILQVQAGVESLCKNSIKESQRHLKDIRIGRQKRMQEMKTALQGFADL